jgi:ABC-type sugar transport system permease subunit
MIANELVALPQSSRRPRGREIVVAYALMAPALLILLGVLAYPVAWEVGISLTDFSTATGPAYTFVGLRNYRAMLADVEFWSAVWTTVAYFLVATVAKLALGVGLALLLARPSRWRAPVFVAVFLPWAFPGGVTVIAWYWLLNPPLITSYSVLVGNVKHAVDGLLGTGAWAFTSVALFNVWRGASFTAVFLLAGINAIPTELFEYARLESSSVWQRFREVTLPLLRPYLALAVFLGLTTAFADLANVWMLTGGRIVFPVLGTQAYWLGIHGGRPAAAAARSLSLVPLLAGVLVLLFRWFDAGEERRS